MSDTLTGVLWIVGLGVAALAIAALADLRSARRAAAAASQAPDRGEAMAAAPTPDYVLDDPHRPRRSPLTAEERAELEQDLAGDDLATLNLVLADDRLATHSEPERAIVRGPLVVVCPEGVGSVRELLPTLERASQQRSAILVAAPRFDPELLDVMSINADRGTLVALPLRGSAAECERLANLCGATPVPRVDLQSGYLPHSVYGRALLCVAGADQTMVVAPSP